MAKASKTSYNSTVRKKELDTLLINLVPKLYELSFVMVPDDLQASQIVIDSITAFVSSEREWLHCMDVDTSHKMDLALLKKDIYRLICKRIYEIGFKRSVQIPLIEKNQNLFDLDIATRTMIYLKYKTDFTFPETLEIVNLTKPNALAKLYTGKEAINYVGH